MAAAAAAAAGERGRAGKQVLVRSCREGSCATR